MSLKTHKDLEDYILALPNTKLDYPFGEDVAVYKVTVAGKEEKMFALIPHDKDPLSMSLKCDPNLAVILRDKYESIMGGYHLNKKHWNTIVLTGQLEDDEITGLILHSYSLVTGADMPIPKFKA